MSGPPLLSDIAASAAVTDLKQLRGLCRLPRLLLFKVVRACYREPKKILALRQIIKNWPYETFSAKAIGVVLAVQDVILIAILVQIREIGKIRVFDLTSDKFCKTENELATNALLNVALGKSVSSAEYEMVHTKSYSESLKDAAMSVSSRFAGYLNNSMSCTEVSESRCPDKVPSYDTSPPCSVFLDVQVNDSNFPDLRTVLETQKQVIDCGETSMLKVLLFPVNMKAFYLNVRKTGIILDLLDPDHLKGLDLEYCCLLQGARLPYLFKHAKRFDKLEKLNLGYNMITPGSEPVLISWLQELKNLRYLDFSYNRTGDDALAEILIKGIQSANMHTLILTGVGVGKRSMEAIASSSNLNHLRKLCLDQNPRLPRLVAVFEEVIKRNHLTLLELDISSCGFTLAGIKEMCPVLSMLEHLQSLNVWENRGLGDESIRREILPLLSSLEHLRRLPPVMR